MAGRGRKAQQKQRFLTLRFNYPSPSKSEQPQSVGSHASQVSSIEDAGNSYSSSCHSASKDYNQDFDARALPSQADLIQDKLYCISLHADVGNWAG